MTPLTGANVPDSEDDKTPIPGQYSIVRQELSFKPRFPFSPGMKYIAVFKPNYLSGVNKDLIVYRFKRPKLKLPPSTYLAKVYPSKDHLPMNQLKLYVYFSAPMKRGQAYQHIKLFNLTDEKEEHQAFLKVTEELWDAQGKILTLLFDPGRIKRGIAPNLQLGLPLMEGKK